MPDFEPGGGEGGGGGKKVLGIRSEYLLAGGAALAIGLAYMWWKRRSAAASSSTTVITGSVSSNTGISGALLNAILKDWQEHPDSSSSGSTSTGGKKKTTKTSTSSKTPVKTKPKTASTGTKAGPAPKKSKNPKKPINTTYGGKYSEYTVKQGQTLDEIARMYDITPAELAHANTYVKGELPGNAKVGQTLGTGAGLKTGQVLKVPVGDEKKK